MPRSAKAATHKEIGERIRALRCQREMTQVQLAAALGTDQANVSKIEHGTRGLTLEQVMKLSSVLRAPPDRILGHGKLLAQPMSLRGGKLVRYLEQIQQLPAADQRAVLRLLEGVLARNQMAQTKPAPAKQRRTKAAKASRVA